MTTEQAAQLLQSVAALGPAIQDAAWAVVGSIWALIFSVTWKG